MKPLSRHAFLVRATKTAMCLNCKAKIGIGCCQYGDPNIPAVGTHRERIEATIYQHHKGRVFRTYVASGEARRIVGSLAIAAVACPRGQCQQPIGQRCQLTKHLWGRDSMIYDQEFPSTHRERLVEYLLTIPLDEIEYLSK